MFDSRFVFPPSVLKKISSRITNEVRAFFVEEVIADLART